MTDNINVIYNINNMKIFIPVNEGACIILNTYNYTQYG